MCSTLCNFMDYTVPGILQNRILEWVAFPFSRASSQPRDQTQVSHIAGDSLPAEPQGKPKNIGVGSLSLLQGILPTQELNQDLLHCRQLLYQLSHQGSPIEFLSLLNPVPSRWSLAECLNGTYKILRSGFCSVFNTVICNMT